MISETTKKYTKKIIGLETQLKEQRQTIVKNQEDLRITTESLRLMEKLSDMKRAANEDYKYLLEAQNRWLRSLLEDLVITPEVMQARVRARLAVNKDIRKNEMATKRYMSQDGYMPSQDNKANVNLTK